MEGRFIMYYEFEQTQKVMLQTVDGSGKNRALIKAILFSENMRDLQSCVKQAHGTGSERFQRNFAYIL